MIVKDMQPLSVIEDEGFRELVTGLDRRYSLPSHRDLNSEEVRQVREKVKAIVTFYHHSVKASYKLAEIQEEKGLQKKKLITDVDTRWNSIYYMLECFEEQYEVITTTLCLFGKHQMCLSSDELETVKNAVQVLEPFEEATREMSAEKITTLSKIIPLIRALQDCAMARKTSIFSLCDELQKQFAKKFNGMQANFYIIVAGPLLDPRFKKVTFADSGNSKRIEDRLINIMKPAVGNQGDQQASSTVVTHQET
ncbi:hypothetical protein Pmani_000067 [Petrolisthes manimaculis]|uniref:Zinc finger BED domain-containing protein 4 n=1 Tax=Petrolisthes manimaculis TaxID=1843537 RepID=A0AAE1QQV9_9EUCA|nr:hypothetical protein Pmani_000067 [Petrolisthes manimaculis]